MMQLSNIKKYLLALLFIVVQSQGIDLDKISLNGFTSVKITKQLDEIGYGDPNYSFDAELFDLLANFQISDHMRVTADVSWNNGAENKYGSANLEYAFIEHTFLDEIKFRIGKILTPFGVFNEMRLAKPAYYSVDIPLSTSEPMRLKTNGFSFFPASGIGASLTGETTYDYSKHIEYNLFFSNGIQDSATNPYEKDGNKSKSITGRFKFDVLQNLKLGKSVFIDNVADGKNLLIFSDGYEAEYVWDRFSILGEGIISTLFSKDSTGNKQNIQQRGAYMQASYNFNMGMTPYLRVEVFDPNSRTKEDYTWVLLTGLHYEFSNWYVFKLSAAYHHYAKNSHYPLLRGAGYTEIQSSLVLGF